MIYHVMGSSGEEVATISVDKPFSISVGRVAHTDKEYTVEAKDTQSEFAALMIAITIDMMNCRKN